MFRATLFMCTATEQKEKLIKDWLNCWLKKRNPNLEKHWQTSKRQPHLLSAKILRTHRSRVVLSNRCNLCTGKSMWWDWKNFYEISPKCKLPPRTFPALAYVPPVDVKPSSDMAIQDIAHIFKREQIEKKFRQKTGWTCKVFRKYLHRKSFCE